MQAQKEQIDADFTTVQPLVDHVVALVEGLEALEKQYAGLSAEARDYLFSVLKDGAAIVVTHITTYDKTNGKK